MRDERERAAWTWAAALLYAATAAVDFVRPLARGFGDRLLGTALFAPDAILNAGILEWGYRSLWSSSRHVFEWTAGFPLHDSLAATENLIGWQLFYTPLRLLGCGPVAAYNLLILISFVLSGLGAALLARRFGAGRAGAVVAGFVFAFVPFHLNHVIQIQTLAVCWCPFVVLAFDRCLEEPTLGRAVALVGLFALTALSGVYLAVFLSLLLPLYAALSWLLGRYPLRLRTLATLLGAAAASGVLLLPVALPYLRFGGAYGYRHPEETIVRFSLEALALLKVPRWLAFWSHGPFPGRDTWTPAFPGVVALLLAAVFLFARVPRRESRQTKALLVLLALTAFVLSLGPVLKIRADAPTGIPLPGKIFTLIGAVRWPMRILLFGFLFGAVLAGLGFSELTKRLPRRLSPALLSLAVLLLFVEYRPRASFAADSVELPAPLAVSGAYAFLAAEADRGGVVELPVAGSDRYRAPYLVRYVYGSAGHLRRVVAFHGAVIPKLLDDLLAASETLPDEPSRRFLASWGVSRVVVHRGSPFLDPDPVRREKLIRAGYPVLRDGPDATVFALPRVPSVAGLRPAQLFESLRRTVAPCSAEW
jgi:hypothetical protein